MKLKLIEQVTFNGAHVEAGEEIELSEISAQALIAEGKAEALEPEALEPEAPKTPDDTPADDKVALDKKYTSKIPELKEHAKAADVEFKHDATKAEIIDAVIEAGKAADVLGM